MARQRDEKGRFLPGNTEGNRFKPGVVTNPLGGGASKKLTPKQQMRIFLTESPVPEPIKKMYRAMYGEDPENILAAINGVTTREALQNGNMKAVRMLYEAMGLFDSDEEQNAAEGTEKAKRVTVKVIRTRKENEQGQTE